MSTLMSSFVQKITHTSSSMSVQGSTLRLGIRKTCRPSGSSSHTALMQLARLQRDYMLSGKKSIFVVFSVFSYL
jgi:hypothetical protein